MTSAAAALLPIKALNARWVNRNGTKWLGKYSNGLLLYMQSKKRGNGNEDLIDVWPGWVLWLEPA